VAGCHWLLGGSVAMSTETIKRPTHESKFDDALCSQGVPMPELISTTIVSVLARAAVGAELSQIIALTVASDV
jgi:hypothetical protein